MTEVNRGFQEVGRIVSDVRALGMYIHNYVELLTNDSMTALKDTGSPVIDTEISEKWPLVSFDGVRDSLFPYPRLEQSLQSSSQAQDRDKDTDPSAETSIRALYVYQYGELASAYKAEGCDRTDYLSHLVHDLSKWAEIMAEKGWPLMMAVNLRGRNAILVHVYDNEDDFTRAQLSKLQEARYKGTSDEGRWFNEKVFVLGSPEQIEKLSVTD